MVAVSIISILHTAGVDVVNVTGSAEVDVATRDVAAPP